MILYEPSSLLSFLDNQIAPPIGGLFLYSHGWLATFNWIDWRFDMTVKTLSNFVASLNEKPFSLDGITDYKSVDAAAKEYFGGAIPNAAIWKVINALKKAQQFVEVIDDL